MIAPTHERGWILIGISWLAAMLVGGTAIAANAAPIAESELRLAVSVDGVDFRRNDHVLCRQASAPSLARLPDGSLLAIFDWAHDSKTSGEVVMAATRSADEGRTWSAPEPLDIRDESGDPVTGRGGVLVRAGKSIYRLYFSVEHPAKRSRRQSRQEIKMAYTRDGLHYRVDDRSDIPASGVTGSRVACARLKKRVHLFGTFSTQDGKTLIREFVSRDGRRFDRKAETRIDESLEIGTVAPLGEEVVAYASSAKGIHILRRGDSGRWDVWKRDALDEGSNPAVIKLKNETYLMVYQAETKENAPTREPLVGSSQRFAGNDWPPFGGEGDAGTTDADWEFQKEAQIEASNSAEPGEQNPPQPPPVAPVFAPKPNFSNPFDYVEWFKQEVATRAADDAADIYNTFIPGLGDNPNEDPQWIGVERFLRDYDVTSPTPWDPANDADREASRLQAQPLLDAYREAASYTEYSTTVQFAPSDDGEINRDPRLFELLLPSLRSHRSLCKATLADAWRLENGRVSAQRMIDASETVLRNADHMHQGITLIEDLVGLAEEHITRKTLHLALKQGVFDDAESLSDALDMLETYDGDAPDPARQVRGEHAFTMDMVQHMFSPADDRGLPRANAERIRSLEPLFGDDTALPDALLDVTGEEVQRFTDSVDQHYRRLAEMMRTGYPLVRAADIDAMTAEIKTQGALADTVVPSLTRVHQLRARAEAWRRATRLTVAAHLFEKQNGRWPESLDEMPANELDQMRIDPFSGNDFGYSLGPDGPTIYSTNENGIDDGGTHVGRWDNDPDPETGSDDFVFWPPQE